LSSNLTLKISRP